MLGKKPIVLGRNRQNPIYNTLISWSEESRTQSLVIDLLSTPPDNRPNSPEQARNILVEYGYLRRRDNEPFINLLARILILPINDIINVLAHSNIRVILNYFIRPNLNNCRRKQLSDLKNDNYWHEKFCDLKPQINKISGKITIMKVLDEHTQGGNLKAGTTYVGTSNGVYYISVSGNVFKFDGLNFPITSIKLDRNGSAYVTNSQEEVYHLNLRGLGSKKLDKVQSSDLDKELRLYYFSNKLSNTVNFEPTIGNYRKREIFTLNLGKINPVDNYKKINFLDNYYSDDWGTRTKWGSDIYDSSHITNKGKNSDIGTIMRERNNNLHNNIKNFEVNSGTTFWWLENVYAPLLIQSVEDYQFIAWVEGLQKIGLTWYWQDNNYFLQVNVFQYLDWKASGASLECWIKMGNGIKLYNDDYSRNTDLDIDKEKIPELNLFYDDTDKNHDFTYIHDWYYNHTGNKIIKTFNLSRTNPVDYYNKIEFLGTDENFKLSRISWGNTPYYSSKKLNDFNNKSLYQIIKNYKFDETNKDKIADYTTMVLQPKTTEWWSNAWLEWSQSFGLTWYWEKGHYYLQAISREYANDGGSLFGGSLFMGIGKGIRLYNDDVQDVEAVNENTNSWKNNEIINVINNEENLTLTASIEPSNNFDINDINSILNFQNQSVANVSSTNITTI